MKCHAASDSPLVCDECFPQFEEQNKIIFSQKKKIESLEEEVAILRSTGTKLHQKLLTNTANNNANNFASVEVENEQILSEDLLVENFENYYDKLLHKYPLLCFLLGFLFSGTHKRKENAKNTAIEWKNWSFFYKIFICEMLLRTKQAKSILRIPMLISLVFVYTKVPRTCL